MTAEEFVAWAMNQELGRFELIDGVIIKMNSERSVHARVKRRIANTLEAAMWRAGLDGEVFGDGMAVKISANLVHEPDAMLRMGAPLADDTVLVTDPVIVVELLSPSTGPVDTSTKLVNYFTLPSVQHYLIVNTTKRIVLHYTHGANGQPVMKTVTSGELALTPPGIAVDIAEFFAA